MEARALQMLVGDLRAAAALEREAFDLLPHVVSLDTLLIEAGDFAQTVNATHPVHVQIAPPSASVPIPAGLPRSCAIS
jgi:hypothetical protein